MSRHIDLLREIAAAINSHGAYRIADWFTEDFRLYEPSEPDWPTGHAGASRLLEKFRPLNPPVNLEMLDTVEEGDRVAVRWQLSATYNGAPVRRAMLAIYRFDEGRIAEDWGIPCRGDWP